MEHIIIDSFEIWEYFEEHAERLAEYKHLVAENADFGITIWLTVEQLGLAMIVEEDDVEIYRDYIMNETDAEVVADCIYDSYVRIGAIDKVVFDEDEEENEEESEHEEDILYRESDLDIAVNDFLSSVCDEDFSASQEVIDDVKEHFLEYLSKKWGASIYRPMYLKDVDTNEVYFTEYPYFDIISAARS